MAGRRRSFRARIPRTCWRNYASAWWERHTPLASSGIRHHAAPGCHGPQISVASRVGRDGLERLVDSLVETDDYLTSPVVAVYKTRNTIRRRIAAADCPDDFPLLKDLRAEGGTDYAAFPLVFTDGTIHVATWSTRQPGGFTPKQFADLESVIAPLARVAEIRALRRTSENLIDTYVGHQTGERILAGKIRRGYVEAIRAAIWLSDMRGFTESVGEIVAAGFDRSLEPLFWLSGSGRARSRRRSAQIHGRRPVGNFSDRQRG